MACNKPNAEGHENPSNKNSRQLDGYPLNGWQFGCTAHPAIFRTYKAIALLVCIAAWPSTIVMAFVEGLVGGLLRNRSPRNSESEIHRRHYSQHRSHSTE
jgi:hypothetical protein